MGCHTRFCICLPEGPYLGSVYSSKEVAEAMSKKCGLQHYIATIKIEWEE